MEGFDGSHGWSMSPMTGPMLKVGKELSQTKLDADFYSELRDPKSYPEVKTIEKTTFDGRPCYKVSLKRIDGVEDFDFYDVATGLRAGSINTRETPNGVLTMTSIEGNYKKFGTLTQAMSVTQQVMGIEQKITLSTVEYDNVDAVGVRAARRHQGAHQVKPGRLAASALLLAVLFGHARGLDRDLQGGGDVRRGLEDRQGQPFRSGVRRREMGSGRGRAPAEGDRGQDAG